ncbi:aldo/keto reductase [Massiliimalia massiliensis]|uniref:aldo/keto reductase n=1 Tax=Massiliimalia massiliensis TaxID=1852384 RepID=UPI000987846B|nr:aldo/keto reductase [Massiliimalia massiliensis]
MNNLNFNTKIKLNNGVEMPVLGYSTELVGAIAFDPITQSEIILDAIEAGYRRFETAEIHRVQRGLAHAIKLSKIPREEFFISSKPQIGDIRDYRNYYAVEEILAQLETDYLDLYSIHWPHPKVYLENLQDWQRKAWVRLQNIYEEGKARAIGLCNFQIHHIQKILDDPETKVIPAVNQDQFHPLYSRQKLQDYCTEKGIAFGAINEEDLTVKAIPPHYYAFEHAGYKKPGLYDRSTLLENIGKQYDKTIEQVLLRWTLQHGVLASIKTIEQDEMVQLSNVFDFELTNEEMSRIDALNLDYRYGYDPDHIDF